MRPMNQANGDNCILDLFGDLDWYEKGVVARAVLNVLIKQGSLSTLPRKGSPGEIVIPVHHWQLQLLARFSDADDAVDDDKEILLDKLCQIS